MSVTGPGGPRPLFEIDDLADRAAALAHGPASAPAAPQAAVAAVEAVAAATPAAAPARPTKWDATAILGKLRQRDKNPDTEFDRMRCIAASTLSGFIAKGPDATATALMRAAAFQRNPSLPNDPLNLVRMPVQREDLKRLSSAECDALDDIARRVRAGTSTLADLERAQDLLYKAANQVDKDFAKTPKKGDLSGLQITDFLLLQQMVGHEVVPVSPAALAFVAATDRPLEAFARALRPGEHAQVQLFEPAHMVGIGRDPQGRLYAYDSARKKKPYGVYQDKDAPDFRRILEEFEKRRQKVIPPTVLKAR